MMKMKILIHWISLKSQQVQLSDFASLSLSSILGIGMLLLTGTASISLDDRFAFKLFALAIDSFNASAAFFVGLDSSIYL